MGNRVGMGQTGLPKLSSHLRTENLKKLAMERGARLRTIRGLTKLKLDDFAKILSMNAGTVGRIERADTCLSIDIAHWISKQLMRRGLMVTAEWLLTGKGDGPCQLANYDFDLKDFLTKVLYDKHGKDHVTKKDGTKVSKIEEHKEKSAILSPYLIGELFLSMNGNAMIAYVKDNKLSPIFNKGEIVGGIKVTKDNLSEADGKDCIVEIKPGNKIIRTVHLLGDGKIVLMSNRSEEDKPEVLDKFPVSLAIITLRYKEIINYDLKIPLYESNIIGDELDYEKSSYNYVGFETV